jgi:hypothetical protein
MKFKAGDKVAWSVQYLESIGMTLSDAAHERGVVVSVDENRNTPDLIVVRWEDGYEGRTIEPNLAIIGPNARFCKC